MRLNFSVDDMLPRLAQVVSVVNSKNALPILSNVVFQTRNDNGLTITASDSETWLTIKTPCKEFDEPMTFCVLAADIFKVLSNLKGKDVEMTLDADMHMIQGTYAKGRFALPYEDAKEYPRPAMEMGDAKTVNINAANLRRALNKTSLAIANEKLRPIMNGVHFDFMQDNMVAVATDGQKLAKYVDKTMRFDISDAICGFTLPKKPVTLLENLLNGCELEVAVTFTDKCVSFTNDDFKLLTRLLEGNYPPYNRVIPVDNSVETLVNKSEIIEALRRVLPMGNASSELVKLSFTMGNVTISAEDASFSKSADESIDCDFASQELSIGFNGGYMMEILQNIDSDDVKICLKEPSRAGLFKPTDADDTEEYVSLLMPIFV